MTKPSLMSTQNVSNDHGIFGARQGTQRVYRNYLRTERMRACALTESNRPTLITNREL